MNKNVKYSFIALISIFGIFFFNRNSLIDNRNSLIVEHNDSAWNSISVPQKGVCIKRGGGGFSPEIKVTKIPDKSTFLKLMFTDMNYGKEGGHGGIKIPLDGKTEIIIPSFRNTLPKGYQGIKKHHCEECRLKKINVNDYYNGPCSNTKNTYKVYVYATNKYGIKLAKGSLILGQY